MFRPSVQCATVLLFICVGISAYAVQPSSDTPKPDPAAIKLLKTAHDNRDTLPIGKWTISADIHVNDNGKVLDGSMSYTADGVLNVTLPQASADQQKWVHDEMDTALSHRRSDDFDNGEGKLPLTLGSEDHNPLGRTVELNDRFHSSYRLRNGQITQVTRTMGPMRFTITVLATRKVHGDKYLPAQFTVTYFDAKSGAISRVDCFTDRFTLVNSAWIPSYRRVVSAENGAFTTRTVTLANPHFDIQAAAAK